MSLVGERRHAPLAARPAPNLGRDGFVASSGGDPLRELVLGDSDCLPLGYLGLVPSGAPANPQVGGWVLLLFPLPIVWGGGVGIRHGR
jgi:hypothetical protein